MGDKKFILFEFHQDGDLQIGPETLSTGGSGEIEADEAAEDLDPELDVEVGDGGGGGGRSILGGVLALALLIGLAVALRKALGGDSGLEEEIVDVEE